MKAKTKLTFGSLSLPLTISLLALILLLGTLSLVARAARRSTSPNMPRGLKRPQLLNYQTYVTVCNQTENLVRNPGFVQGDKWPDHWNDYNEACRFFYTGEHGTATSPNSVMINAEEVVSEKCTIFTNIEEIEVEPDSFYDYSAWVKSELLQGQAYLGITFWGFQGNVPVWTRLGTARTAELTGTHSDWMRVTGSVQAPNNAEYARVEAILSESSRGSVKFDDVFLGLGTCLDLSTRDDPDPIEPGQIMTYTVIYSNTGREEATNVEIEQIFDRYVDFLWAQRPPDSGNSIWKIPVLRPGISDTITVAVQVRSDARPWLLHRAEIVSDETTKTLSVIANTRVNTAAVAIFIDLPRRLEAARDRPAESVIILRNLGSCDGQADLMYRSSLGTAFSITPSPPYSLISGESLPVTASFKIPQAAGYGEIEVAVVTATLNCAPPITPTMAVATATLTGLVPIPVFLPEVIKSSVKCFKGPWETEPNNTCAEEVNGPLCPGRKYYGYADDSPGTTSDWFSVDSSVEGQIAASLTISPVGAVQLQLWDNECRRLKYVGGSILKHYHLEETVSPAERYYILVFLDADHDIDQPYILSTEFR